MANWTFGYITAFKKSTPKSGIALSPGAGSKATVGISSVNAQWQNAPPTYLVAWDGDTPVASAALFRVYNEPLPLPSCRTPFYGFSIQAQAFARLPVTSCRYIRFAIARRAAP